MAAFSRQLLSGTPADGRGIKIAAIASPGTTVHAAIAGITGFDEIYLWATNTDNALRTVTVEFGGTTNPDDRIVNTFPLPANSLPIPIVTGQMLRNGLLVKVFASVTNVVIINGYVNRIN